MVYNNAIARHPIHVVSRCIFPLTAQIEPRLKTLLYSNPGSVAFARRWRKRRRLLLSWNSALALEAPRPGAVVEGGLLRKPGQVHSTLELVPVCSDAGAAHFPASAHSIRHTRPPVEEGRGQFHHLPAGVLAPSARPGTALGMALGTHSAVRRRYIDLRLPGTERRQEPAPSR
jgi:hypothetical protein